MAGAAPTTITVYGPDDKPVEVAPDQAAALLRSGQYGLPQDAAVPVQKADGTWETVSGAEAVQRAQLHTTKLGSAADVRRTEKEAEFSGAGAKALAFGSGVVDSLALGYGDAALVKGAELFGRGEQAREFIQDADEFAPGSRFAGKAAGFVAPLVASGGTAAAGRGVLGTAARAATAPARALVAGTEAAGAAAARLTGGGNLGRFVKPVVQQGLEMGVYGSGQAASAALVRDPTLDGEALAAAMGQGFLHGAALGAGTGAVFGTGALLAGKAGDLAGQAASGAFSRVKEALPGVAARGEELLGAGIDRATGLVSQATGRVLPEAATLGGKVDRLARSAVDVEKMGAEASLRATGAEARFIEEAKGLPSPVRDRLVSQIDRYPEVLGKPGKLPSMAEQAEAAAILRREAGESLGDALKSLDATGENIARGALTSKVRAEVLQELEKSAGTEVASVKLSKFVRSLEKNPSDVISFRGLQQERSLLEAKIQSFERSGDVISTEAFRKAKAILDDELMKAAGKASERSGRPLADALREADVNFQASLVGERLANSGVKRGAKASGEQTGAIVGAVIGGGGPLSIATAAASAMANRAVKAHSDQFTAAVLREMRAGKPAAEAVVDVFRSSVSDETKAFMRAARPVLNEAARAGRKKIASAGEVVSRAAKGATRAAAAGASGAARAARMAAFHEGMASQRREYDRRRREVVAYKAAAPERAAMLQQRFLASGASPEAAQVAAATATRGADYLARMLPPTPAKLNTLQPELDDTRPDPDAMEAWLKRAAVVDNPRVALQSLGAGTLDVAEVETLREVYPSIYQQVRDEVQVQLQDLTAQGQVLPYSQALQIQTLFGGDVIADATLAPDFIARWQAPPAPPPPAPLAPSRRPAPRFAHLYDPQQEI